MPDDTNSDSKETKQVLTELEEVVKKRERWITLSSVIAVAAGVLGLVLSVSPLFNQITDTSVTNETKILTAIDTTTVELDKLKGDIKRLDEELKKLATVSGTEPTSVQLKAFSNKIDETQSRITNLEKVIMDNPAKALEMPLVRKDLTELEKTHRDDLVAARQEIERIYDLSKWFLGLMVTSSIAIIGLAISNFFKRS